MSFLWNIYQSWPESWYLCWIKPRGRHHFRSGVNW